MTTLKPVVEGLNTYCGPAVLSAITGRSVDECAGVIRGINGKLEIKGVYISEMIQAFNRLRIECKEVKSPARTLYGTISYLPDGKYLIMVPKHFVVVERIGSTAYFIDNHTKVPMKAEASARLMQEVKSVHQLIVLSEARLVSTRINVNRVSSAGASVCYTFTRHEEYELKRDDKSLGIGHVYLKGKEDLDMLINELTKLKENL